MSTLVVGIAIGTLGVASGLLWASWPLGGGSDVSHAAIALGASLIFVVILISLLVPAIEAGRSIGWDVSWIRNDAITWAGLLVVTGLSLFVVWLGSVRPQQPEEVATILLTATGIAVTVLLARRMLGFADPAIQLTARSRREAKNTRKVLEAAEAETKSAMVAAGVDGKVASSVLGAASPEVQSRIAKSIKPMLATARMAWHRREWVLAAQAHVHAIVLAMQYAGSVRALYSDDRIFELIRTETDDLHEMADGAEGRWFSLTLMQNLIECGVAVVQTEKASMPHDHSDQLAYHFGMTIEQMALRRLGDSKSQDIGTGLDGLRRLALAEVTVSHTWGASILAELGLKYAAAGVEARMAHVAWPAWRCGLDTLGALAHSEKGKGLGFRNLSEKFLGELAKVTKVPQGLTSGFEPIIGHWVGEATLVSLAYSLWKAPEHRFEDVARFAHGVGYQVVRLVSATDENWQHAASDNAADVLYHFVAACAGRAETGEMSDAARQICDEAMSEGLAQIRQMLVDDGVVQERYDTRDILHIYLSAWQVVLFATKDRTDLPAPLHGEHGHLMEALNAAVLNDLPADLAREGLDRLAAWLEQEGQEELGSATRERAEQIPLPDDESWHFGSWGWGLGGGDYHTYRGSMMGGFFNRVESHFDGSPA